jgi:transcription initiation factor TFIID TATA-box-binding protein
LNLDALAIGIGLEKTEYEPEQFPGLIYRYNRSTILIFATGKIVITGLTLEETAISEFDELRNELDGLI